MRWSVGARKHPGVAKPNRHSSSCRRRAAGASVGVVGLPEWDILTALHFRSIFASQSGRNPYACSTDTQQP